MSRRRALTKCSKVSIKFIDSKVHRLLLDDLDRDGDHPGRLAIEQAYGYMVHNAVAYCIITTVNALIFLCRENGGKLKITRLIDATINNPTILQMRSEERRVGKECKNK